MARLLSVKANRFILRRGLGSSKNLAKVGFSKSYLKPPRWLAAPRGRAGPEDLDSFFMVSMGIPKSPQMNISLLEVKNPKVLLHP